MKTCVECGGTDRVALVYPNPYGVREALCAACQDQRDVIVGLALDHARDAHTTPTAILPEIPTGWSARQQAHYHRVFNSEAAALLEEDARCDAEYERSMEERGRERELGIDEIELAQEEALACGDLD